MPATAIQLPVTSGGCGCCPRIVTPCCDGCLPYMLKAVTSVGETTLVFNGTGWSGTVLTPFNTEQGVLLSIALECVETEPGYYDWLLSIGCLRDLPPGGGSGYAYSSSCNPLSLEFDVEGKWCAFDPGPWAYERIQATITPAMPCDCCCFASCSFTIIRPSFTDPYCELSEPEDSYDLVGVAGGNYYSEKSETGIVCINEFDVPNVIHMGMWPIVGTEPGKCRFLVHMTYGGSGSEDQEDYVSPDISVRDCADVGTNRSYELTPLMPGGPDFFPDTLTLVVSCVEEMMMSLATADGKPAPENPHGIERWRCEFCGYRIKSSQLLESAVCPKCGK